MLVDTDIKQNYPSLDTFTEELEKNLDNHVVDEEESKIIINLY